MNPTPTYITDVVKRNKDLWALKKTNPRLFSKKLQEWELSIKKRLTKLRGSIKVKPKISVVIPAHDEESYILPTLEGIAAQKNVAGVEVLVIANNCSKDDMTAEISRTCGARVIEYEYRTTKEKPIALARHMGLIFSEGEIYMSTDADTIAMPQWISLLSKKLTSDINIGLVTSHSHMHGREDDVKIQSNDFQRALMRSTFQWTGLTGIGHNAAFLKKDAEEIGGYNVESYPGEDSNISFRLTTMRLKKVGFIEDPDAEVWVSPRRVVRYGGYLLITNFFKMYKGEKGALLNARETL
jgi:glycosyltransferase involved in cell wall biosynthesis